MKFHIRSLLFISTVFLFTSCGNQENLSGEKTMESFQLSNVKGIINESAKTITITLSNKTELSSLVPKVEISPLATLSPEANIAQDFSNGMRYTVRAEDGSTAEYRIVIDRMYSFQFNEHMYEIVKQNKKWGDAVAFAKNLGGYLVEINDRAEQQELYKELVTENNAKIEPRTTRNRFSRNAVWLGGSDAITEGEWTWDGNNDSNGILFWRGGIGGSPVNNLYSNWGREPDNSGGNQNELSISLEDTPRNLKGEWNDLDGEFNRLYFVIEYDADSSVGF